MSDLYAVIKSILGEKNKTFNWLADQIGYSRQGLKSGLVNRTIKLESLEKVAEVLDVDVYEFFLGADLDFQISLENFFENRFLKFVSKKYKTFYEKLALYKDVFIWKVLTLSISGGNILFPYINPIKWSNPIPDDDKQKISNLPAELVNKPYTQWGLNKQIEFRNEFRIVEVFYDMIFESNFFNITDLMEDGIIKDREMIGYHKNWKKK